MLTYFSTIRDALSVQILLLKPINYTNVVKFSPLVGECENCKFNYDHTILRNQYSIVLGKVSGYNSKDLIRDARTFSIFSIISGLEKRLIF